jgi:hypothetical protein
MPENNPILQATDWLYEPWHEIQGLGREEIILTQGLGVVLNKITGSAGCQIADHVTSKYKRLNYVVVLFKQPHNEDVWGSGSKAKLVLCRSIG